MNWLLIVSTSQAAEQRRLAARRESGANHAQVEIIDYRCDQIPIGGYRYDLARWDAGSGWEQLTPVKTIKSASITAALRKARRHTESLNKVISDSANELIESA